MTPEQAEEQHYLPKRYLGDSVYAQDIGGELKLFLDNGNGPKFAIYLEPPVIQALIDYAKEARLLPP